MLWLFDIVFVGLVGSLVLLSIMDAALCRIGFNSVSRCPSSIKESLEE